jgi:hypothetical protein
MGRLSSAIVFSGDPEAVSSLKIKLEEMIVQGNCKVVFVKTSPKNLYIFSEDENH